MSFVVLLSVFCSSPVVVRPLLSGFCDHLSVPVCHGLQQCGHGCGYLRVDGALDLVCELADELLLALVVRLYACVWVVSVSVYVVGL